MLPIVLLSLGQEKTRAAAAERAARAAIEGPPPEPRKVCVTGAGGGTGQIIFRKLLAMRPTFTPLGIVHSEESRERLLEFIGFNRIYIEPAEVQTADITDAASIQSKLAGCEAVVIVTSATPKLTGETDPESGRPLFGFPRGQPYEVDWIGQKNQIDAAAANGPGTHVLIVSSMGGTTVDNPLNDLGKTVLPDGTESGGNILRWKRKAERYLIASGLPYTIVHAGGLSNEPGGKQELVLTLDDSSAGTESKMVPRADVAEVIMQALQHDEFRCRSFDLRATGKPPAPEDFVKILEEQLGDANCDYTLGPDPPEPTCGERRTRSRRAEMTADVSSKDAWLSEWRESIDCWWLATPHRAALQGCMGALGLHLAQRFERAVAALQGKAPTAAATEPGCEWLEENGGAQLELPDFPGFEFNGESWPFELPGAVPPLPRLLPRWQHVLTQGPSQGAPVLQTQQQQNGQVSAFAAGAGMGVGAGVAALVLFVGLTRRRTRAGARLAVKARSTHC